MITQTQPPAFKKETKEIKPEPHLIHTTFGEDSDVSFPHQKGGCGFLNS